MSAQRLLLLICLAAMPSFAAAATLRGKPIDPPEVRLPTIFNSTVPSDAVAAAPVLEMMWRLRVEREARLLSDYIERAYVESTWGRPAPPARTVTEAVRIEAANRVPISSLRNTVLDAALTARIDDSSEALREALGPTGVPARYVAPGPGLWLQSDAHAFAQPMLVITLTNNSGQVVNAANIEARIELADEPAKFECSLPLGARNVAPGGSASIYCHAWNTSSATLAAAAEALRAGKASFRIFARGVSFVHGETGVHVARDGTSGFWSPSNPQFLAMMQRFNFCRGDNDEEYIQEARCGAISGRHVNVAASDEKAARERIERLTSVRVSNERVALPQTLTPPQKAAYAQLVKEYYEVFRLLGRAKACGANVDAQISALTDALAARHADGKNGEFVPGAAALAGIAGGLESRAWDDWDADTRRDREPLPCTLFAGRFPTLQLPAVPAPLVAR